MEQKFKKQYIQRLDIKEKTVTILNDQNINTLEDLCNTSKKDLIEMKIPTPEIEEIEKGLQLLGGNIRD